MFFFPFNFQKLQAKNRQKKTLDMKRTYNTETKPPPYYICKSTKPNSAASIQVTFKRISPSPKEEWKFQNRSQQKTKLKTYKRRSCGNQRRQKLEAWGLLHQRKPKEESKVGQRKWRQHHLGMQYRMTITYFYFIFYDLYNTIIPCWHVLRGW